MDRDSFLSRVGRSAMTAALPAAPTVPERLPDLEPVNLSALFRLRAQEVDAVIHGPVSRYGVPATVTAIASGHEAKTYLAWEDLPVAGVPTALTAAGLERLDDRVPGEGRKAHQWEYRKADLGVTGADAGIAESGSVVLSHGPGRPRMASLVAEVHVVLLEQTLLERTLAHWAQRKPEAAADTTNLVVVTGPSRTGDIEMQLNLGVHGPRHVHIVMIKP